jgi:hypothetical protein
MTYQKDQTGILQTATNNAAALTAAEVAAGIVKSHDTVVKRFDELREHILVDLKEAVEADNAMFKAEEAADAASGKSSGRGRGGAKASGGGTREVKDPGATVINGKGKFAGLTVAEVYALTGEEAEAYGYVDKEGVGKPGALYIDWMKGNKDNPFMQRVATAFLEGLRAQSDAA